jgi:hypothetical protein
MARMKLIARKSVRAPPRRNAMPTESHIDSLDAGYFLRTLRTVLLALSSIEPRCSSGPQGAAWKLVPLAVRVVIYERPTTDHIHRICQVVKARIPRWTFEDGMRGAAREALVVLLHEADERIAQSQYRHFLS